jgi:hypothetical protein
MSIDSSDLTISASDIRSRIEELEEEGEIRYVVYRTRNLDEIESFDSEDDAQEFIDKEDYDPDRVKIKENGLDEEDQRELEQLGELESLAVSYFGGAFKDDNLTLYRYDFFDSEWAVGQAENAIGSFSRYDWPFDQIDWEEAAREKRDEDYTSIEFDGETYYGEDQ